MTYTYEPFETSGKPAKVEIYDPNNQLRYFIEYTYEDTGDFDKIIQADGSFQNLNYDPVGNLVEKINALDKSTTYSYDALNRRTAVTEPGSVITGYSYDTDDNITTVTDAQGKTTHFTYDDFGRKTSMTSPDTGLTLYEYDESDNLISKTDSNTITTTSTYNALNQLTAVHYPDPAQDVFYTYNNGLLNTMEDGTGRTDYKYNQLDLLHEVKRRSSGVDEFRTRYEYNHNMEIISIRYPLDDRDINYHRDVTGRIDKVTTPVDHGEMVLADNITYAPFGPLQSMTLGNGITVNNSYNQLFRLTNTTAGSIYNRDYLYLATGHVQTISDNINPAASQSFNYDDLGRLKTAQGAYGDYSWNYDEVGNRLSEALNSIATSYVYEPGTNKLAQVNGASTQDYFYDNSGNMTDMGATELNWDQNNRLESAATNGTLLGEYVYNGKNQRTIRSVDGRTIYSVYDQSGNLLQEIEGAGHDVQVQEEYVYLDGIRLAFTVPDPDHHHNPVYDYYISDHLNTGQLLTDDQGAVVWQGNYSPFGAVDVVVNTVENNLRFPGQYFDAETGLHYNWHRYYDPATGRYITADPIGLEGGMNLYAYIGGDPVNGVDPFGLWWWYKRWGGPDRTAGIDGISWDQFSEEQRNYILADIAARGQASPYAPQDAQDQCYMNHDICYGNARLQSRNSSNPSECERIRKNACDKNLRNCLGKCGVMDNVIDEIQRNLARPVFYIQPGVRNAFDSNPTFCDRLSNSSITILFR